MLARLPKAMKNVKVDKARRAIILFLGNKVLREVAREKVMTLMWEKLKPLYMTKWSR